MDSVEVAVRITEAVMAKASVARNIKTEELVDSYVNMFTNVLQRISSVVSPSAATPLPPPGDASCDGTVDSIDAALILQFSAGLLGSLACQEFADVNSDGTVNSIDAALILQFTAGLLDSLPP